MESSIEATLSALLKRHWLFFIILIAATFFRFFHVSSSMIFIGDQARDFIVARDILEKKEVPLLGIPSSIPRFRQGPLFIYFTALGLLVGNNDPFVVGYSTAILGVLTVVAIYFFSQRYISQPVGLWAAFILSFSPMAIVHSRMPWVMSPIPFLVILFLWMLMRIYEGKSWAPFFAGLSFALVFHNELATFPYLIILCFVLWQAKNNRLRQFTQAFGGIVLGLLPQIVYDITHQFSQIGGFLTWVAYRLTTAFIPGTDHTLLSLGITQRLYNVFSLLPSVLSEGGRYEKGAILVVLSIATVLSTVGYERMTKAMRLLFLSWLVFIIAFLIHGAPSEAYIPGLMIPMLCILGFAISNLRTMIAIPLTFIIGVVVIVSGLLVVSRGYFTMSLTQDNWEKYRYGASLATQKSILSFLSAQSENRCLEMYSFERAKSFPTTIDNFEYLVKEENNGKENQPCAVYAIDRSSIASTFPFYATSAWHLGPYIAKEMTR